MDPRIEQRTVYVTTDQRICTTQEEAESHQAYIDFSALYNDGGSEGLDVCASGVACHSMVEWLKGVDDDMWQAILKVRELAPEESP